ncbi:hypothetical protein BJV77DRAFT_278457 [Russula vinacea]|nr:hypothetical protein BJV77DRAFT_278457 [Russula vinacea]
MLGFQNSTSRKRSPLHSRSLAVYPIRMGSNTRACYRAMEVSRSLSCNDVNHRLCEQPRRPVGVPGTQKPSLSSLVSLSLVVEPHRDAYPEYGKVCFTKSSLMEGNHFWLIKYLFRDTQLLREEWKCIINNLKRARLYQHSSTEVGTLRCS